MSKWDARSSEDDLSVSQGDLEGAEWPAEDSELLELLEAVWQRIDHEELIHLTQELVRIPSVFCPDDPQGNETQVAHYIADYLDRGGFEVRIEEAAPGRPNVWAF